MIVCPVCEHQQEQALECEVCGKDLGAAAGLEGLPPPPVPIEPLPGLESTSPEPLGDVPVERLPDLEVNNFARVGEVAVEPTPGVEPSSNAPVGDIPVLPIDDLDEDARAADDGVRTPAVFGMVTCRYCKNVQPTGTLCERCGMKLPAALQGLAPEIPPDEWVRCKACGAPGPAGERCKECGRVVDAPEA